MGGCTSGHGIFGISNLERASLESTLAFTASGIVATNLIYRVWGGILFGVGWSITGMCPGPILVNLGEGKLYAIAALAGVLVGASLFGTFYERLSGPLRLPALRVGTGDG